MASSNESKDPSNESGANGKEVVPGEKEEAPPEMLTSDYYKVSKDMPERFNHPGMLHEPTSDSAYLYWIGIA